MKLDMSFVGEQSVSELFDAGVNVFGINRKMVPKSVYNSKYIRCRAFSWRVERFPMCRMFIPTPYYAGYADLCSL